MNTTNLQEVLYVHNVEVVPIKQDTPSKLVPIHKTGYALETGAHKTGYLYVLVCQGGACP